MSELSRPHREESEASGKAPSVIAGWIEMKACRHTVGNQCTVIVDRIGDRNNRIKACGVSGVT